jgi:hypothetical protein
MLLDTRNKNIYGVKIPTVFKIFDHQQFSRYQITSCIMRDRTTPYGHDLHMLLDTRNKNIHGLGVGISTAFKIFGHILNQGGHQDHSIWLLTSHHHLLLDTRNKNFYGLGVGI